MIERTYLDWNATTPLRTEARIAMIAAMDLVGNPSSVHAEGRHSKGIIEKARSQISEAFGANASDIIFTSGATEAAALGLSTADVRGAAIEHDCVKEWIKGNLDVKNDGLVAITNPQMSTLQAANSETGILQKLQVGLALTDAVQVCGKMPFAFDWSGVEPALNFTIAHGTQNLAFFYFAAGTRRTCRNCVA